MRDPLFRFPAQPSRPFAVAPGGNAWLAAGLTFYVLMIAIGSIPGQAAAIPSVLPDKLLHFIAYGLMTVLFYRGMPQGPASRAMGALVLAAALGGIDEGIQSFFPYRTADWDDWSFDVLAALSAAIACAATSCASAHRRDTATGSEAAVEPASASPNENT
jgi:VanZ family protein